MGKIVVSENVTLDGVVQDPAGAEGFGRGGWVGRVGERGRDEAAKVLLDEALGAEASYSVGGPTSSSPRGGRRPTVRQRPWCLSAGPDFRRAGRSRNRPRPAFCRRPGNAS
jgi:hypothetical protein